ncbi:MAG TPA: hypothetical protein DIW17_13055 [Clostridiales bacterium]|nr:hypothetical protein [Lachnospiraceae bacterium]HBI73418.1 hypothetical protein [Lachnospiraceae bacterium]HCS74789.1 hypothetical protein [Clostridiales bacterium]
MHYYLATDIFSAANQIFRKVYTDLSGVFTLICVVVLAVCLLGMMFCRNGRLVEEFRSWRNRIIGSWIIFNVLGSIITYGETLFRNTKWS